MLGIVELLTSVDLSGLKTGLNQAKAASGKAFDEVGTGVARQFGASIADAATNAAQAVVQFTKESVQEFQSFQKQTAEVFTLLPGASEAAMSAMRQDVLDFSVAAGRSTDEVTAALYQSLSSGIPPANVFDFMQTASDAALGGVTDLETAVNGISSVVNAYGSDVLNAAQASDVMFTAVRLGQTTFGEMASSLSSVIPTAASLGISFTDVAANLAAMTVQGVTTSVATTQLRAAFVEASKSGTALDQAIKELNGKSFAELIASGMTSTEIFKTLRQSMPEQEFRDLFGSVEASNAALLITSDTADTIIGQFGTLEDVTGSTTQAAETMGKTGAQSAAEWSAALEVLKITLGQELAPQIQGMAEGGSGLLSTITDLIGPVNDLSTAVSFLKMGELGDAWTLFKQGFSGVGDVIQGVISPSEAAAMRAEQMNAAYTKLYGTQVAATTAIQETTSAIDALAVAEEKRKAFLEDSASLTQQQIQQQEELAETFERRADAQITTEEESFQAAQAAAEAANQRLQTQIDLEEEAALKAEELAEAHRKAAAAQGDYFAAAVNSTEAIGFFNESATELGQHMVTVGGRTAAQSAELSRLQGAYNKAAQTIRDYQTGIKGVGLGEEALAEKIAEQTQIMANAEAAMSPLLSITGQLSETNTQATINQDAVNQAIFDAADAAGASAAELAVLGGALGLYSEEATNAALKSALIQEKITALAAAYIDPGTMSIAEMRDELNDFIADLDNQAAAAITSEEAIRGVAESNGVLGESAAAVADKIDGMAESADAATSALNAIPSEIGVHIGVTSDSLPDWAGGWGGNSGGAGPANQGPQTNQDAFALGGYTGNGPASQIAGVVHRRELVVPESALNRGALGVLEFAQKYIPNLQLANGGSGAGAGSQSEGVTIYIDARGANPDQVQAAVERALDAKGYKADLIRRTR